MIRAYSAVFTRCKLDFTMVESDVGAIGGSSAHEFMVLAETGEDAVVKCPAGDYGANLEKASTADLAAPEAGAEEPMTPVDTPGAKTIDQISAFLKIAPARTIKTLIFETDKEFVAAVVRGDLDVHEVKLKNHLGADHLQLASEAKVEQATGGPAGFSGPVGLSGVRIVVDRSVPRLVNVVAGANQPDRHLVNVNPGRDFDDHEIADIAAARAGDPCPRCGSPLEVARGIEVGNIFKLGTKYSVPMDCSFLDENGDKKPMVMGCYGLGIGRTVAAVVEQNHDDAGIVWPPPLAPFDVHLIAMNVGDEENRAEAERVYAGLREKGIDVLFDDRDERPGVKFKDADLLGFPLRMTVGGRSLKEGKIELSRRKDRAVEPVAKEQAVEAAVGAVRQAQKA
jgi:prolyl-tRNA synthetase